MHPQDQITDNLADTSKPNPGRIYEYVLGGGHYFEIDQQAADKLIQVLPFIPKMARLQRWCLSDLAIELTFNRGFDVILDFASGLPTQSHLHYKAKPGTVVIYSDWDEVTVRTAKKILGNTPNVYYFLADARYPENLLKEPQIEEILNGRRDIALVTWGVGSFLSDDDIKHAADVLYQWSGPKACWAFHAQGATWNLDDPAARQTFEIYERMGTKLHARSLQRYKEILAPWQPDDKEFVSLLDWHGENQKLMSEEDIKAWGESGGGYGTYLVKS